MKAVLEARVLELDDELKEAYNKYDNIKSEMVNKSDSILFTSLLKIFHRSIQNGGKIAKL